MPGPTSVPAPPPTASSGLWRFLVILFGRLRFIWLFLGIALVIGNWDRIMGAVDRWTRPPKTSAGRSEFEWFCPMHPSVVRDDDTQKCPICGMALSRRKRGEKTELPPGVTARVQLSPFRIQQAGVATDEVGYRTLVRELRTVGFVEYDERRLLHLSARIAGRADELFVNYLGARVKAGDPVYSLYSPDLVATQEQYRLDLREREAAGRRTPPDAAAIRRADENIAAARERLVRWGVTEDQLVVMASAATVPTHLTIRSPISGLVIEKDIHAGHYVVEGEDPYTLVDDSTVWLVSEVFERDLGLLQEGQVVEVTTEAYPGEAFEGTVSFVYPMIQPDTRTVKVRMDVRNAEGKLKSGMYATAHLRIRLGRRAELYYLC